MGVLNNIVYIYNEFVITFTFLCILVINMGNFTSDTVEIIGTVCIVFITTSLMITWALFLPGIFATIIKAIIGLCSKKPEEKNKKKKKGKKNANVTENVKPVLMTGAEDDKELYDDSDIKLRANQKDLKLEKMNDEKMSKLIFDNLSKPTSNAPYSGKHLMTSNN